LLELFDLEADPSEKINVAKGHADVATRLHDKLVKWREAVGAKAPQTNPRFIEAAKGK
jgi:hypothetical protein